MPALELVIITPEGTVYRGAADYVQVAAAPRPFGVLPRHAPLLAALQPGALVFEARGQRQAVAVSGGLVEVRKGSVVVLADAAELAADIDVQRAEQAAHRARERLGPPVGRDVDVERAERALQRARNRLEVARRA